MNYILDLIILAICVITVMVFAKKGFVFALVRVIGLVAAFILAVGIGDFSADFIYKNVIGPNVATAVKENIDNGISGAADSAFEALPKFIKENGAVFGLTKENFTSAFPTDIVDENTIGEVLDKTVKPIVEELISILITLICFIVLMFVVRLLSKVLNKLFSFSVVGTLNKTLGGIVGLPIGVIFASIFCLLIQLSLTLTSKGLWIFTADTVETSKLYNLIISIFN